MKIISPTLGAPVLLLLLSCLLTIGPGVRADEEAVRICRETLHVDVESDSHFENGGCLLQCNVHGNWKTLVANDGSPCDPNGRGVCRGGQCRGEEVMGFIDIFFNNASLWSSGNYYVVACIRKDDRDMEQPILDTEKNCYTSCTSQVVYDTNAPSWNEVCGGSDKFLYPKGSRIFFDVWNIRQGKKTFYVGAHVKIARMLRDGENGRAFRRSLGLFKGHLTTTITWTPRDNVL